MVRGGGRDSDDPFLEMAGNRACGALDDDAEYCSGSADVHLRSGLAGAARWHRVQHHREQAASGRPHGAGVLAYRPLRYAGRCARSRRAGKHRLRRWWDVMADDNRVGNVESPWRPTCDTRRALPLPKATKYAMVAQSAVFMPGMYSLVHHHSGVEAVYVVEGEACFETPTRAAKLHKGETLALPGDTAMRAVVTGTGRRHVLAVIVHDAGQPATMRMEEGTGPKLVACK